MSRAAAARKGDDDADDPLVSQPMSQRRTNVAAAGVQKPVGAMNSAFDVAQPPAVQRRYAKAPEFDPSAIVLKKVPIPKSQTGMKAEQGARYQALLDRMKPGDCAELMPRLARGLQAYAKVKGIKVSLRTLSADLIGVWKV